MGAFYRFQFVNMYRVLMGSNEPMGFVQISSGSAQNDR